MNREARMIQSRGETEERDRRTGITGLPWTSSLRGILQIQWFAGGGLLCPLPGLSSVLCCFASGFTVGPQCSENVPLPCSSGDEDTVLTMEGAKPSLVLPWRGRRLATGAMEGCQCTGLCCFLQRLPWRQPWWSLGGGERGRRLGRRRIPNSSTHPGCKSLRGPMPSEVRQSSCLPRLLGADARGSTLQNL